MTPWYESREAQAILRTFLEVPPPVRLGGGHFGPNDRGPVFTSTLTDRRVADLRTMHRAAQSAALDTPAFWEIARNDEQVVIRSFLSNDKAEAA